MASSSILIADDHPMVRRALREALFETLGEGVRVEETGSLGAVREVLSRQPVDLLMLDLNMPGMDGMLSLNALRAEFPAVPILVVTAIDEPSVVRQAIEFGASGFLPKSAPYSCIGEAVTSLLAGDLWFPEGLADCRAGGRGSRRAYLGFHAAAASRVHAAGAGKAQQGNWFRARRDRGHGQNPRLANPEQACG